jgi:hypothetical protein
MRNLRAVNATKNLYMQPRVGYFSLMDRMKEKIQ